MSHLLRRDPHLRQADRPTSCRPAVGRHRPGRPLGTPIYVEDALLDAEGVVLQTEDEPRTAMRTTLVEQFREFIEGIRPEDFAS